MTGRRPMTWERVLRGDPSPEALHRAARTWGVIDASNPLHIAARIPGTTPRTIRVLLDLECDPLAWDDNGESAAAALCASDRWDLYNALHLPVDIVLDDRDHAALHHAAAMRNAEAIADLVRRKANPLALTAGGWMPLHDALNSNCLGPNLDWLTPLLPSASQVIGRRGLTALHFAASNLSEPDTVLAIVDRLLEAGCDPTATDDRGLRPTARAGHGAVAARIDRAVLEAAAGPTVPRPRRRM